MTLGRNLAEQFKVEEVPDMENLKLLLHKD